MKMDRAVVWMLFAVFAVQFSLLRAHREHKVHNIVLYPDKHSWCKTTPIKQVVTWPECSSQELDNNVCVGACFSYMVPHSEPSAPGDLIRPYCDSCQPLDSIWHTVTLDCKDEENKPMTMQKKVQIITNCSCSSCTETSRIKPDYNTLLQSLQSTEKTVDKNTNVIDDTPDFLSDPHLNTTTTTTNPTSNKTKTTVYANEKFVQLLRESTSKNAVKSNGWEIIDKFAMANDSDFDWDKLNEMIPEIGTKRHDKSSASTSSSSSSTSASSSSSSLHDEQKHKQHSNGLLHHTGPHHSLVLNSDVKEKIDVEPHHLHPAVAGQEISYHDNILVGKNKKKDF